MIWCLCRKTEFCSICFRHTHNVVHCNGFFVVQVRDALRVGDHVGAMNASKSARSLNIVGIIIGCTVIVIMIVGVVVTFAR